MQVTKRVLRKYAAGGALAGVAGSAMAEVPAAVTTAIASLQTDGVTIATAFLVAAIAVMAVKFLRRGAS